MAESEESTSAITEGQFVPWVPSQVLQATTETEIKYSRGFLLSKPELWFPGFTAHWLPLFHSLGLHMELLGVEPELGIQEHNSEVYVGSLDDELLALVVPPQSFDFISRSYVPEASATARHLVVEYFARRFLTSVVRSWSANDNAPFRFESDMSLDADRFAGGVKLRFRANGEELALHVGFGKRLLDRLDELWVSHLQQGPPPADGEVGVKAIIGASFVAPSEMEDTLTEGKYIPLMAGGPDQCLVLLHDEPWVVGELCAHEETLVFRTLMEAHEKFPAPSGTTQILFQVGVSSLTRADMMVISQPRALLPLQGDSPAEVDILMGGQKVGAGSLASYNAQLFVQVKERD